MQFQNKLYSIRKKQGLSQQELGMKVGVSGATISRIEKGTQIPSFELALSLADAIGYSGCDFFSGITLEMKNSGQSAENTLDGKLAEMDAQYAKLSTANQKVFRDIVDIMKIRLQI